MLVASVILSLFFVLTSAHGIGLPDLTNCFRILFHLRRYFTPTLPRRLLTNAAPFEILIACTSKFLPPLIHEKLTYTKTICRLLGWSALDRLIVLLAGCPLNSFIAKRSIRIEKGLLVASDKRIGMLNELIGDVCPSHSVSSCNPWLTCGVQVKFIKFFGWEER